MMTLLERFTRKIETPREPDGCWSWTGSRTGDGYGQFRDGKVKRAHRVSHELFVGHIPEHFDVDHKCRNRGCVRPDHLEAVTTLENCRRGGARNHNAVKTHCPRGHLYGTTRRKDGGRVCLPCARAASADWRLRQVRS
jgi:hypothetical protein